MAIRTAAPVVIEISSKANTLTTLGWFDIASSLMIYSLWALRKMYHPKPPKKRRLSPGEGNHLYIITSAQENKLLQILLGFFEL
jgi:hypothetical protein